METIKIVSGVIDSERLTLHTATGEVHEIMQGDVRLRPIIDFITAPITEHGEVDMPVSLLDHPKMDPLPFEEFEQKAEESGQKVSFFRVAKRAVAKFIRKVTGNVRPSDANEQEAGEAALTGYRAPEQTISRSESVANAKREAVEQIMAGAVPASSPHFQSELVDRQKPVQEKGRTDNDRVVGTMEERLLNENTDKPDTIVAVVNGQVIPGMEMIESQFKHALKYGSVEGVTKFLERLGKVIDKRGHAIDDVLRWMQRSDMRVSNNGEIIALKALTHANGKRSDIDGAPKDQYVDQHSRNVLQWVGSEVVMSESLVDHNRGQECSNGLHIARRGYLTGSGFSDVCFVVLLNPEDVIAVPNYDANKVRACRYRIVAKLTDAQFNLIKANKPFSDDKDGAVLLANITEGNHIGVTHITRIGAGMGGKLEITTGPDWVSSEPPATPALDEAKTLEALPDTVVQEKVVDKPVDVIEVQATANLSRKDVAKQLYDDWVRWSTDPLSNVEKRTQAYDDLLAYKKQCKCSWDKLGILSDAEGNVIMPSSVHAALVKTISGITEQPTGKLVKPKPTPKPKVAKKKATKALSKPTKTDKTMTAPTPSTKKKKTPREELELLLKGKTPEDITKSLAESALSIKQAAKKAWGVLGVTPEMERAIKKKLDAGKW